MRDSYICTSSLTQSMERGSIFRYGLTLLNGYIWHRFILPLPPPFRMVKNDFLRWLKLNFRNGFDCWNLTHHLIKQSRSFFEQKMGCRTLNGCVPHAQIWVFFQNFQNTIFLLLYYSACKKATSMDFLWDDRGYPAVRFEYKTASERFLVIEI